MKKNYMIVILLVIIITLLISITIILNKNTNIIKLDESKEQLSTDDGIVTTSEHLAQMQSVETEFKNFKTQISEIATAKGQTPASTSSSDIVAALNQIKTSSTIQLVGSISNNTSTNTYTFNVSSYSGYQQFTTNNFLVHPTSLYVIGTGGNTSGLISSPVTMSYNSTTGILSITLKYEYKGSYPSVVGASINAANIYLIQ